MESKVHPPPRLLLGASLLFWGAITGSPFIGLMAALLVESANWIRSRWDFDDTATSRAWRLSMFLILIAGTLLWLDGDSAARYTALPRLMVWLPLFLLPLQFIQSFGTRDRIALNSFSFFSKLHRERNRRMGLGDSVIYFNFGNLYFIATITAASLGIYAQEKVFFPGLVLLGGWLVFSRVKLRPVAFISILTMAGVLGMGGQIGLEKLYEWANNRASSAGYIGTDPTVNKTAIGSLGKLKQSPEMLWRLSPLDTQPPPRLLRTASYNLYRGISWKDEPAIPLPADENNFSVLPDIGIITGEPQYSLREGNDITKPLPTFSMRGAAMPGSPLPLPGNTSSLKEFDLDAVEINTLGTVRVSPKKSIIGGLVRWKDDAEPDSAPTATEDLRIPEIEREIVEDISNELGLDQLPDAKAKIATIRTWFKSNFTYTRYLSISPPLNTRPSPIGIFLTKGKRGHCEYFATAATLLLRASGVPARYCVGFSVQEKDPKRNEYIIRGTHGHAWTRAWDGEHWVDLDATPSGWLAEETSGETSSRWLPDTYQRLKEDFFLWRNRPKNRLTATFVMWGIGLSVFAFIAKRLWKSRLVSKDQKQSPYPGTRIRTTPLHDLELRARKILGPRPEGTTYAAWLGMLSAHGIPQDQISEAIVLHQQLRFDPAPPPTENEQRLIFLSKQFESLLKRTKRRKDHA